MTGYEKNIELKMQRLSATLSEKDRRRYAGIEAAKLGHVGIDYVSGLFDMDPKTVRRGLTELEVVIEFLKKTSPRKIGANSGHLQ
jgi:hypothetical protein